MDFDKVELFISEKGHELVFQFIVNLRNESLISNMHVVDCFRNLTTKMSRKISSIPLIYSHIAGLYNKIVNLIWNYMMKLNSLSDIM